MPIRITLLLMLLLAAAPAGAQGGAAGPQADAPDFSPAEIQRLFDAMLLSEAQRALELTDTQYPEFVIRLRTLQDTRRTNLMQRVRLMGELQRLSNPRVARPDEAALKEQLAALQELESRSAAELRRAYNQLDDVLDLRQQARFRVLEETLERRKLELMMRARQNRMQRRPQLR